MDCRGRERIQKILGSLLLSLSLSPCVDAVVDIVDLSSDSHPVPKRFWNAPASVSVSFSKIFFEGVAEFILN